MPAEEPAAALKGASLLEPSSFRSAGSGLRAPAPGSGSGSGPGSPGLQLAGMSIPGQVSDGTSAPRPPAPNAGASATAGVWIGRLPRACVDVVVGEAGSEEGALRSSITDQLNEYGEVLSITVRVKEGENKSWALVTFALAADAAKALAGGLRVRAGGEERQLTLKPEDVERELSKVGSGALERTATAHKKSSARPKARKKWQLAAATVKKKKYAVPPFPRSRFSSCVPLT